VLSPACRLPAVALRNLQFLSKNDTKPIGLPEATFSTPC
jgi:hypothetical protein